MEDIDITQPLEAYDPMYATWHPVTRIVNADPGSSMPYKADYAGRSAMWVTKWGDVMGTGWRLRNVERVA